MLVSLGKITCVTPGQPIRATSNLTIPSQDYNVHSFSVQRLATNTGNAFVSLSPTDDRAALTEILGILDGSTPVFGAGAVMEPNGVNMANIYIDFNVAGESVFISAIKN